MEGEDKKALLVGWN